MNVLVNKDGRQLGPYTVEEARTLVLSGQLAATDWAWPDDATQWIPLKQVPGFSSGSTPVNAPGPTPTDEKELWSGRPSQILNLRFYFIWLIILSGVGYAVSVRHNLWPALAVLAAIALLQTIFRNIRLRSYHYTITNQRVRVVSGLFSRTVQEVELFRVKDTGAHQGFIQRLFGLGTITLLSGDADNPRLTLYAIPHAIEMRERLRHEVLILRQRYNVRELDMM